MLILVVALHTFIAFNKFSDEKPRVLISMPRARGLIKAGPDSNRPISSIGILSIGSNPTSSNTFIAVVFPAPDGPVIIITSLIRLIFALDFLI